MNMVKFRVMCDLDVDLMPTAIPGLPGVILHAADELYLMAGSPVELVRCGVAVKMSPHLYGQFAPIPSFKSSLPFAAVPHVIPCTYDGELCVRVQHLRDADTVHIKPGDPVAALLFHFAPTIAFGEAPADEVMPAFRDTDSADPLGR